MAVISPQAKALGWSKLYTEILACSSVVRSLIIKRAQIMLILEACNGHLSQAVVRASVSVCVHQQWAQGRPVEAVLGHVEEAALVLQECRHASTHRMLWHGPCAWLCCPHPDRPQTALPCMLSCAPLVSNHGGAPGTLL